MATERLQQRTALFMLSPTRGRLGAAGAALEERLMEAVTYAELSEADRALLREGVIEVSVIGAPDQGFGPSGDDAAIDAAEDDVEALEVALDTVGPAEYGWGTAPLSDVWDVDDDEDEDEDEVPGDVDGWVGL